VAKVMTQEGSTGSLFPFSFVVLLTLTLQTWTKWWLLPVLANGRWDLILLLKVKLIKICLKNSILRLLKAIFV